MCTQTRAEIKPKKQTNAKSKGLTIEVTARALQWVLGCIGFFSFLYIFFCIENISFFHHLFLSKCSPPKSTEKEKRKEKVAQRRNQKTFCSVHCGCTTFGVPFRPFFFRFSTFSSVGRCSVCCRSKGRSERWGLCAEVVDGEGSRVKDADLLLVRMDNHGDEW